MGDRGEWPMPGYASADAILIGTWPLASGNSITVRGRQHSSGSVDVRVTADGVGSMKRRRTPSGTRVMLGDALNDPWKRTLARNGVVVTCLTSRTLNRVIEVIETAARLLHGTLPES